MKRSGEFDPVIKCGYVEISRVLELTRTGVLGVFKALEIERNDRNLEKKKSDDYKRSELAADKEKRRKLAAKLQYSKAIDWEKRPRTTISLPRSREKNGYSSNISET